MKLQCEQRKSHCLMGQLETFNATKCKVRSMRQGGDLLCHLLLKLSQLSICYYSAAMSCGGHLLFFSCHYFRLFALEGCGAWPVSASVRMICNDFLPESTLQLCSSVLCVSHSHRKTSRKPMLSRTGPTAGADSNNTACNNAGGGVGAGSASSTSAGGNSHGSSRAAALHQYDAEQSRFSSMLPLQRWSWWLAAPGRCTTTKLSRQALPGSCFSTAPALLLTRRPGTRLQLDLEVRTVRVQPQPAVLKT